MRFLILTLFCVFAAGCAPDDDLKRLDLDVFRDGKTGKLIFAGRPTKITDGDTIVLADFIKIRMNGIDAPESRQTCTNMRGDEYNCGRLATEHLKQIIGKDRVFCVMYKYDRYGRYLTTCYKPDGTDIHAQMVRDGYAVVSTYGPETYLDAEQYARKNNLGLWRGHMLHPHCWRHRKKRDWAFKNLCDGEKYYTGWENMNIEQAQ